MFQNDTGFFRIDDSEPMQSDRMSDIRGIDAFNFIMGCGEYDVAFYLRPMQHNSNITVILFFDLNL